MASVHNKDLKLFADRLRKERKPHTSCRRYRRPQARHGRQRLVQITPALGVAIRLTDRGQGAEAKPSRRADTLFIDIGGGPAFWPVGVPAQNGKVHGQYMPGPVARTKAPAGIGHMLSHDFQASNDTRADMNGDDLEYDSSRHLMRKCRRSSVEPGLVRRRGRMKTTENCRAVGLRRGQEGRGASSDSSDVEAELVSRSGLPSTRNYQCRIGTQLRR